MSDASDPGRSDLSDDAPRDTSKRLWLHVALFGLTAVSVFKAGTFFGSGPLFAIPLLSILVAHESGHYIAARIHGVPASLPYFIPVPKSLFGTLGAVITMRERIRSRNALFDIGASGPLAGMVVALPVLAYGLMHSPIAPNPSTGYSQEGQSLLYALMKRVFAGAIPAGSDVQMHPTAAAGWVGLLITMINLLPWGQLDGGHIAFALFGERQNKYARVVRSCLPLLVVYNLVSFAGPILRHRSAMPYAVALANSAFWLVWYVVTGVMARFFGADHPPFEHGSLTAPRRITAWLCLTLFVVLFMPTPWAQY